MSKVKKIKQAIKIKIKLIIIINYKINLFPKIIPEISSCKGLNLKLYKLKINNI